MDPAQCSVVVVAGCDCHLCLHKDSSPSPSYPYTDLLQQVFAQVVIENHGHAALAAIRQRLPKNGQNTLLLIDLDICPHANQLVHPAIVLLQQVVKELKTGSLHDIAPVVCSDNESTKFMLQCIQEGAADYVLKPLRKDVLKTMFLNLHRYQMEGSDVHAISDSSSGSQTVHESMSDALEGDLLWNGLQNHRLREIFLKDSRTRDEVLSAMLCSGDFSPFDLDVSDLIQCVCLVFEQVLALPELSSYSISKENLYDLFLDIYRSYHDNNPYHNFSHAVDVLQTTYYYLCQIGVIEPMMPLAKRPRSRPACVHQLPVRDIIRPCDIFALLMASIGHDVGHPGVNNMFLINIGTPLALLYNDRSVLESFHTMALFHILKKHGIDQVLGGPRSTTYAEFRKSIVHVILATDMGLHNEYVAKFRDQADRLKSGRPLDLSDAAACERERTLLFSAIIKCADIGNVSRPFKHGLKWAQVLVDEFSAQGDLERELGLPVMPINDRGKLSQEDVQIGFIKHVALPLFEVVDSIIPNFTFTVDAIKENLNLWEQRKDLGVEPLSDAASCHSQATVEVIHSRRSSLTNINPYGIQSFKVQDEATLKPKSSVRSLADMFSKYNKREVDWQTSEAPSPLCACCIQ
ncbi:hypothetical protein INT43_008958 [Umbelopsis isabellina]|uniref:Phosphodiesterase n=1 Tax=Mortierella isabellina TaxID=91625 RepID=A0A8H7PWV9_MORIS|nr:hypothetical protein INT43_008958 [Umbelopsis isabellina]